MHTRFALRRPVSIAMLFAAVAVIGLMATRLLPLEQFPDVKFPFMGLEIPYPGSTPEEVEDLVTKPIQEALATLPGIHEIRSTSASDRAQVQILFDWGMDLDAATFEVRTKLDAIRRQLPAAANRILMFRASSGDQSILTIRISADQDLSTQYDVLDRFLKRPVERLDGVARVQLAGVEPREIRILVDSGRIAAHGIDVQRLVRLLERSNFSVSAGQVTSAGQRLAVRPVGELTSIEQLRNLVIEGNVRLRDVASVELISPELTVRRNLNLQPAVGLDVYKSTQANVIDVADRVLEVVDHARGLPQMQGITIFVIDNQAESIRSSLASVGQSGLIGGLFAILVLYAFLRHWPTTLFVSLAVPLSLLVTLAVMYFTGLTINVMSMMGMMLAIGMLVDNGVVVTESVYRHRQQQPEQPVEATLTGVREVGIATLAGTLTSVIVFVPIIFGEKNQMSIFLAHVAIPIVVAMLASLIIAQTLIPMLTSRFPAPPRQSSGGWIDALQSRYTNALRTSLLKPRRTAAALVGLVLVTGALLAASTQWPDRFLKVDMWPQDAGRQLVIDYGIEGTHPIERVEAAVRRIERYLDDNRERFNIESIYSIYETDSARSVLNLQSGAAATLKSTRISELVAADMPDIIIGKPSFNFDDDGGSVSEGFGLLLRGESTERLTEIAADVARVLTSVSGLESVRTDNSNGEEEVQIVVDRGRAAALGLTPRDVATTVAAAMRGDRLREFRGPEREIIMRLAFRADDRQTLEDLARLPLYLPGGQRLDLGAVATFSLARAPRAIKRVNRMTTSVVEANVASDATLGAVRDKVEELLANYRLPAGYTWQFGRGIQNDDETQQAMLINLLFALAMIYFVMAALFESTLMPVSIVVSIFLAVIGVIWTLFLTRTTLTFMALIGVQILMGVIVNIGIVLVAHINDLRQAGLDRFEAIVQAGRDRLRPILMTTLTTVLGLSPLAVGDAQLAVGIGGPSYAPMARAIMGGLAFGALVSLFAVPAFYVWIDDAVAASKRYFASTAVRAAVDAAPSLD
ncbi:MAG TPA: efflux RND transporter permease subunit [Steroidobacteraceae bacterium]|nr:efflux RND transporter permease subunit [Steroidobacteraceae bacterium]